MIDAQAERVSLFNVQSWKVMIVQDGKELLSAKLEHILVPFEFKHVAPQDLGICPSQIYLLVKHVILTFYSEETQVMDAPFMDKVIRVCEPVLSGDLMGIEKQARSHSCEAHLVTHFQELVETSC